MIILPKYIGKKRTVRAKNGLLINVLIEQTEECVRLCKVLELDIFKKDAIKKESNKSKRNSEARGGNNDK